MPLVLASQQRKTNRQVQIMVDVQHIDKQDTLQAKPLNGARPPKRTKVVSTMYPYIGLRRTVRT